MNNTRPDDSLCDAFQMLLRLGMVSTAALMVAEWAELILKCERNERHPDATEEQQKQSAKDWAYFIGRLDEWFQLAHIELDASEVVSKFADSTVPDFFVFVKTKFREKSQR